MGVAALDPQQQYYTLLDHYNIGDGNFTLMPVLATAARKIGQDSLSKQVTHDYINHYLEMLASEELWTKKNVIFLYRNSDCIGLNDRIFQMYYLSRNTIDSIYNGVHFSDGLINYLLFRDEVQPMIEKALKMAVEPNWHQLKKEISNHYDVSYAKKNVLEGRIEYYKAKRQWKKYIKYFIREQEADGIENWEPTGGRTVDLNNDAYEVFEYAKNKRQLEKALSWINRALAADTNDPEYIDTKANLLYKLGKRTEGLALEEKSHAMAPGIKGIADSYEKMKSGLPTWSTE